MIVKSFVRDVSGKGKTKMSPVVKEAINSVRYVVHLSAIMEIDHSELGI